jgi:hypothetical protein
LGPKIPNPATLSFKCDTKIIYVYHTKIFENLLRGSSLARREKQGPGM